MISTFLILPYGIVWHMAISPFFWYDDGITILYSKIDLCKHCFSEKWGTYKCVSSFMKYHIFHSNSFTHHLVKSMSDYKPKLDSFGVVLLFCLVLCLLSTNTLESNTYSIFYEQNFQLHKIFFVDMLYVIDVPI